MASFREDGNGIPLHKPVELQIWTDVRVGDETGKLILRRKPLDEELWSSHQGHELIGLIALIRRIRAYWEISTLSPYFTVVPEDDQGLYDTFTSDFHFLIGRVALNQDVKAILFEAVPPDFIDSDLAMIMDDEIKGSLRDGFNRASSALRREAINQNVFTLEDDPTGMFSLFDNELNAIRESNIQQTRNAEVQFGFRKATNSTMELSTSLEKVEKAMREIIAKVLSNDWTRVPRDIRAKAEDRITKEMTRNPALQITKTVERLGFCDLGDLETIIIAGNNWGEFEQLLGPKPELRNRFQMLSPYRNAKAHHREPDEIAINDARSAVTWFKPRLRAIEHE